MKQQCFMKAVSLTAAAAIGCSSLIGNGLPLSAAAAQSLDAVQSAGSKPVPVIVRVTGKPILTTAEGAAEGDAFLTTPEAVRMAESLKSTQGYVQDEIRRLYPELAVKYSYSVLYNGFSCELPENLIGAVEELSFVESVSRTTSHGRTEYLLYFSQCRRHGRQRGSGLHEQTLLRVQRDDNLR